MERDPYQEWADAETVLDHEADPESFRWKPLQPPNNKPKMKAPTVTPQQIEAIIGNSEIRIETLFDKVTLVSVKLPNGFVLTESSGAVSKENYDEKIGTEICMTKIRDQIWKLEGYNLQTQTAGISVEPDPLDGHTFGYALAAMENGYRVAREGWNGKGMWICKGEGCPSLESDKFWNRHTRAFAEANGGTAEVLPYLIMKTADGKILMGWLASQSDMLATDWCVLPN